MASSIIHLAIAEELMKRRSFISAERLRFGVVLPDAGDGARSRSHLRIQIDERGRKTYDLERFRAMYGARMQRDELYLGYYLHLIQDIAPIHLSALPLESQCAGRREQAAQGLCDFQPVCD